MAFNLQTFRTRALTAIVFVAVMLIGLLYNHWTFFLLFSITHFGCWFEYQKIIALIDPEYKQITDFHRYGSMVAGWAIMLWICSDDYHLGAISLHEIGWWLLLVFVLVLPMAEVLFTRNMNLRNMLYSFLGLLYISISWALMVDLRQRGMAPTGEVQADNGFILPMVLIASIWINDTMAYLVGSFIGKTPLSPISPKKTWEGTIGGAVLCVVLVSLLGYFWLHLSLAVVIGISLIAAVAGTIGDLLESKLKRMAGLKDSGQLMPGHGGFLDRFDSLLIATPFAWLYMLIM